MVAALPANSGPVGATTIAFLNGVTAQLNVLQAQLTSLQGLSTDQVSALGSLLASSGNQLNSVTGLIATAAGGGTAMAPDGSLLTATTVDIVDRLLQSSSALTALSANQIGSRLTYTATASAASAPETAASVFGTACKHLDSINSYGEVVAIGSLSVCTGSLIPQFAPVLGPICGLMKLLSEGFLAVSLAGVACDALQVNLTTVTPNPGYMELTIGGASVTEAPSGTFGPSPAFVKQGLQAFSDVLLDRLKLNKTLFLLLTSNKVLAKQIHDLFQFALNQIWQSYVAPGAPVVFQPITLDLTFDLAPLLPNPNSLVTIGGYTVSPRSTAGMSSSYFDLTAFRLLDSNGNPISDSTRVNGNTIPVTVGTVSGNDFKVSPPALTFSTSQSVNPSSQQITVTNTGTTSLSLTVSNTQAWLIESTLSFGLDPGQSLAISVTASVGKLAPGTYTDTISISDVGGVLPPKTVPVLLTISPASANQPSLTISSMGCDVVKQDQYSQTVQIIASGSASGPPQSVLNVYGFTVTDTISCTNWASTSAYGALQCTNSQPNFSSTGWTSTSGNILVTPGPQTFWMDAYLTDALGGIITTIPQGSPKSGQ